MNMILAAGQHMEIYSSDNLKDWKYESSFGEKYGNHSGVWGMPRPDEDEGSWHR